MNMILRDIRFPVREATITGYMLDPDWLKKYGKNENHALAWEVVVEMKEMPFMDDWPSPRISWTEFSLPIRRWFEIEGQTLSFPANKGVFMPASPFSYFQTHEAIPFSKLTFAKRTKNKFSIEWEGVCSPLYEEPFYKDVPFRIETEAVFKEIGLQAGKNDTDATVLARLSEYIDTTDLIQHPIKETVRDVPIEPRFGMIETLVRRAFGCPETEEYKTRSSIFDPRL